MKIPFSPPDITELEINEVIEALKSGWITTGPRTKKLEDSLARYCHTNRFVCLNSATAAEELIFRVCGIGEGDEVIVPAYTYTATAAAAIHCGAKVVFVDSQKNSPEMDYNQVEQRITSRTKAIVAVDLGGIICDYERLFSIVESKRERFIPGGNSDLGKRIQKVLGRVLVFADSAHALGASRNGKMAGEIADFTDFSFHAVKNFTTAEGGAATWKELPGIEDEEIYCRFQQFALQGQSKSAFTRAQFESWDYDVIGPWYKYNMTDIMAAIGLKQLERYPELLQRRRDMVKIYDDKMNQLGVSHLQHMINYDCHTLSACHLYLTRIPGASDLDRRDIMKEMARRGICTNVHYKPLPMMSAYKNLGWKIADFPNAYSYYENLISLPFYTKLTDEEIASIIENYGDIINTFNKGKKNGIKRMG